MYFAADVMFPTGDPGPAPYDPKMVPAIVKYGTSSGKYNATVTGQNSVVYNQIYGPKSGNLTYQSPIIHHVLLTGLVDDATYYYIVGNDMYGWSAEKSFKMYNRAATTIRVGVWGDIGDTANSSATLDSLAARNPDIILSMADFTYADTHLPNATIDQNAAYTAYYPQSQGPVTDQRRWSSWSRLTETVLSHVPMVSTLGNHEIEPQILNNNVSFFSANYRYPQPVDGGLSAALQPMYAQDYLNMANTRQFANEATAPIPNSAWGASIGPVHIISLNSYVPYGPTSKQVAWFVDHMKSVDRTKTPWLAVMWHTAAYVSCCF